MRRRSYAESAFSNIKSEAEQSLRRPSMRVMGRTKMTFISVFVTAAANLRLGRIWIRRQHKARHPEQGPALSPAMRQGQKARQRAAGRERRREKAKARSPD